MLKQHDPKNRFRLPLNLQLFAEGGGEGDGGSGEGSGQGERAAGGEGGKGGSKVEFSPEQQAELNRIVGERLGIAQNKWEKDFQAKLEAATTEAEKLAKMNADQKAEYERQKLADDLAKREGDITRRELRATALESLAEKGIPRQLADILDYSGAEATNKSIESVEKAFRAAVEAGVNERLKGGTPRGGGKGGGQEGDFGKRLADYAKKDEGLETARKTYFS